MPKHISLGVGLWRHSKNSGDVGSLLAWLVDKCSLWTWLHNLCRLACTWSQFLTCQREGSPQSCQGKVRSQSWPGKPLRRVAKGQPFSRFAKVQPLHRVAKATPLRRVAHVRSVHRPVRLVAQARGHHAKNKHSLVPKRQSSQRSRTRKRMQQGFGRRWKCRRWWRFAVDASTEGSSEASRDITTTGFSDEGPEAQEGGPWDEICVEVSDEAGCRRSS